MNSKIIKFTFLAATATAAEALFAGVPLNNLQGAGGIAFNPLAYTAGLAWEGGETNSLNDIVSKPQVGGWYVNLNDAKINWWAAGAAFTAANSAAAAMAAPSSARRRRLRIKNRMDMKKPPASSFGQDYAGGLALYTAVSA